jgi:tetratricopeptide (TPR) repeat protein
MAGLLVMLFALLPRSAQAITKQNADDEYMRGNYQQAIIDYQELLSKGVSAELYYNLGNAYYRTDNLAKAILNYERAQELAPGDEDIRFNLQFARSKTIDKITPESEMFFVTWYHALVNLTGVDEWAKIGLASIIVALVLMLVYLFAPQLTMRKVGFFGSITLLVVFVLSNLFAWQQKTAISTRAGAIIMSPSANVKRTPVPNSADVCVLHEGTRVDITDKSMKGWVGVKVADGREGWIPTKNLEEI